MTPIVLAVLGDVALRQLVGMGVSRDMRTAADYLRAGLAPGPGSAKLSLFAT